MKKRRLLMCGIIFLAIICASFIVPFNTLSVSAANAPINGTIISNLTGNQISNTDTATEIQITIKVSNNIHNIFNLEGNFKYDASIFDYQGYVATTFQNNSVVNQSSGNNGKLYTPCFSFTPVSAASFDFCMYKFKLKAGAAGGSYNFSFTDIICEDTMGAAISLTLSPFSLTLTTPPPPSNDTAINDLQFGGSSITKSPSFATDKTFNWDVPWTTNSINLTNLTGFPADSTVVYKDNSTGTVLSSPISLPTGSYEIRIIVTAADGSTTETYTLNVNRTTPSSNVNLGSYTVTKADNSSFPAVSPSGNTYTINSSASNPVAYGDRNKIKISITAQDALSKVKIELGSQVFVSETLHMASTTLQLNQGNNNVQITIKAEDTSTVIYTFVIYVAAPLNNADLTSLSVSGYTITPNFSASTTSYSIPDVANNVASIAINASPYDTNATVTGNGSRSLSVGANILNVVVTADDGITTKTYTINVTRSTSGGGGGGTLSNIATLSSLSLSINGTGISLSPSFATNIFSYSVSAVANNITSVTIAATVSDTGKASVVGTGVRTLFVGTNLLDMTVTAEDGTTTQIYTISIYRAPSTGGGGTVTDPDYNNDGINKIEVVGFDVGFDKDKRPQEYLLIVPYETDRITVNVNTDSNVLAVSGGDRNMNKVNGQWSAVYTLEVGGNNLIDIKGYYQNGGSSGIYHIIIYRQAKISLAKLDIVGFNLGESFNPNINTYHLTVPKSVTSVTIDAQLPLGTYNYYVDGSRTHLLPNSGKDNPNYITVVVFAQDNTVVNTYVIVIIRADAESIEPWLFIGVGLLTATLIFSLLWLAIRKKKKKEGKSK